MDNVNTQESTIKIDANFVKFDNPEIILKPSKTPTNKDKNVCDKNLLSLDDSGSMIELSSDKVLSLIMPPREWEKDGVTRRQKISSQPATITEVKQLSIHLDNILGLYKAREVGICPIRREVYQQCFNEIIRQLTLNCTERGYLMIQIRNELMMTINEYQRLYVSKVAYGVRKMLLEERKNSELIKNMELVKVQNDILETEMNDVFAAHLNWERESANASELETLNHAEQISALKKLNLRMKNQLEMIIAPTKT